MTAIKCCGLTTLADARYCAGAGADYLGFVVDAASPRRVSPETIAAISEWLYGPKRVAVMVNPTLEEAEALVRTAGIDLVQLHGDESPAFCAELSVPVIKAIRVAPDTTAEALMHEIERFEPVCAHVLFDTARGARFGGTGYPFDWTVLGGVRTTKPWFVAGGINPENVGRLLETVRPGGIDVSSGVESAPGVKDYGRVDELVAAVRSREMA